MEPRAVHTVQGGKALHDKVDGVCVVAGFTYVKVMVVQRMPRGVCWHCGCGRLARTAAMAQALCPYGQLCFEGTCWYWLLSSCWRSLGGILGGIGLVLLCSSPIGLPRAHACEGRPHSCLVLAPMPRGSGPHCASRLGCSGSREARAFAC